ncbi:recombination protein RecR [Alphaproteobacteria bacterium]|nr:recombination protein RecR [Alphaproteobacteria bacterium]
MAQLMKTMNSVYENSKICQICNNIDTSSPCFICEDPKRDDEILCVVCDISDLWSIERAGFFSGKYHVLGGKLSAVMGVKPADLDVFGLYNRLKSGAIKEVIMAMSADIDGQTTMLFANEKIKDLNINITTLSHGVPIGGELENLDDGTIIAAFNQRRNV